MTSDELNRYDRQIILPELGQAGQVKINNASVLIVGAGGLGCPVIQYLSAAGVGHIGVADGDRVAIHNLHRQILFTTAHIGEIKSEIACQQIRSMNSNITSTSYGNLNSENILSILSRYDIVADCTDNFASRYLLNDACVKLDKVLVSAAVTGFEGQLGVFNAKIGKLERSGNYRDVFPNHVPDSLIPNCAEAGILGPSAGVLASMQALEILKIIAGIEPQLVNTILNLQLTDMSVVKLKYHKLINNKVCSENRDGIVLATESYQQCDLRNEQIVSAEMLRFQLKDKGENINLVDIRELSEYAVFNLGHVNIPMSKVHDFLLTYDVEDKVYIYCQSGLRSSKFIANMEHQYGYKNLFHVNGGIEELKQIFK